MLKSKLELKFRELESKWLSETRFLSFGRHENEHYQAIIGLGSEVIPLLLKDLKANSENPRDWFYALYELTGVNPCPPEIAGKFAKMVPYWLEYGKEMGYLD